MVLANFAVTLADAKTVSAVKVADPRKTLVERLFTTFDKESGAVTPMGIRAVNCSLNTPTEQGIKGHDLANSIALLLNYKAGVPTFNGESKGRDFVIIGKRPSSGGKKGVDGKFKGNRGSDGIMIDANELDIFVEYVSALRDALKANLPDLKAKAGISSVARPAQAAAAAGPARVDLDDDDGAPEV